MGKNLSAARFMSPELLNHFEPVAREQHEQVVTNRASQLLSISLKSRATRWLSMNQLNPFAMLRAGLELLNAFRLDRLVTLLPHIKKMFDSL